MVVTTTAVAASPPGRGDYLSRPVARAEPGVAATNAMDEAIRKAKPTPRPSGSAVCQMPRRYFDETFAEPSK